MQIRLADIRRAETVVRRFFPPTPLIEAPRLSARFGTPVALKLDCYTPIRAFKLRGALVKIESLDEAGITGGVVTASAGNHGLAVARAARLFGRPAVICVPEGANPQKVALIEQEGARVIIGGRDYQAAYERCLQIGASEGLTEVHAYDDPFIITGQGTLGLELLDSGHPFDTVLVGIGGGGLISGLATAIKAVRPEVRVIGVQPEGADSMIRSLEAGHIVELEQVQTIADGLGARKPGRYTYAMTAGQVDAVLSVSDQDLLQALQVLLREERIIAEPAGAAGLAALLRYGIANLGRVLVIISGANVSDAVLAQIL